MQKFILLTFLLLPLYSVYSVLGQNNYGIEIRSNSQMLNGCTDILDALQNVTKTNLICKQILYNSNYYYLTSVNSGSILSLKKFLDYFKNNDSFYKFTQNGNILCDSTLKIYSGFVAYNKVPVSSTPIVTRLVKTSCVFPSICQTLLKYC